MNSSEGTRPEASWPRVGAVIVDYFRTVEAAELARFLGTSGVVAAEAVVIVTNGSTPQTMADARAVIADLPVKFIELPNPGYGAAVNAGASLLRSRVDHLLVLTHEVKLPASTVELLSSTLRDNPQIGLAGPLLMDSITGRIWSAGGERSPVRGLPRNAFQGISADDMGHELRACAWLDGAAFMVRASDFVELGGMAEDFFLYMEDVELGSRYRRAGQAVVCVPGGRAEQSSSGGLDQFLATRNFLWLLRLERDRARAVMWVVESITRLALGWLKPGDGERHGKRLRGLVAGMGPLGQTKHPSSGFG